MQHPRVLSYRALPLVHNNNEEYRHADYNNAGKKADETDEADTVRHGATLYAG